MLVLGNTADFQVIGNMFCVGDIWAHATTEIDKLERLGFELNEEKGWV